MYTSLLFVFTTRLTHSPFLIVKNTDSHLDGLYFFSNFNGFNFPLRNLEIL